ncbi:hypothetical protein LEP1GSC050_2291 [Leptospira broomii serovar Hurstbridge str. 5399]|uniref:Uncharacterized protein n=1 Tax=Leptospira broomii serovar Hurstbridge str. 5399 TaxID=1049789 RepID=T0GF56_9LEPT|nr:hypothetical protein LEP1GSC050_2291 [Leptospira broomii serovar Hurstbridge str. 5399]
MQERDMYDIGVAGFSHEPSSTTRTWAGAVGPKGGTAIPV